MLMPTRCAPARAHAARGEHLKMSAQPNMQLSALVTRRGEQPAKGELSLLMHICGGRAPAAVPTLGRL